MKLVPNELSSIDNLVKLRFVLNVVLRHLESKSGLYFGLSQFLFTVKRFRSFLIVTHDSFLQASETHGEVFDRN